MFDSVISDFTISSSSTGLEKLMVTSPFEMLLDEEELWFDVPFNVFRFSTYICKICSKFCL